LSQSLPQSSFISIASREVHIIHLVLTDDEKAVINILKANSPIDLNELKEQTGLSNKKWDKAIKGLTKNKLARVEKTDAGLFVSLV
jgi:lysyl-tRNA synthetase class 2